MIMKTLKTYAVWSLACLLTVSLAGCLDLSVDNTNSPNRDQVLAAPSDVENLIGGSFSDWFRGCCDDDNQIQLSAMADEWAVSWGNYDARVLSSEPRVGYDNSAAATYRRAARNPWNNHYLAISNASDGLAIIAADEAVFTDAGIDVNRIKAFGKFIQGVAHGYIATRYDQGFTVDETVDLANDPLELKPYTEMVAFAIQKLEEAIAIANSSTFTIEASDDWIFGLDVTSGELARIAHSYIARFMVEVARDPAERQAVNWSVVMNHVDQGITADFAPIGDDPTNERDHTKDWGQEGSTWMRADYKSIGPADESGGYQNWLATPVQDRNVFDIESSDRRLVAAPGVTYTAVASDPRVDDEVFAEGQVLEFPQVDGTDFRYWGVEGPFPASRGTYHYSSHAHKRYEAYHLAGRLGEMVQFKVTELDLLKAEGLLWTGGDLGAAAELINRTRVDRGELEPATAATPVGNVDANVDATHDTPTQAGATLWAMLKHEKRFECFLAGANVAFNDDRGWGDLVQFTPIHFAVPGAELEVLQLPNYTFGGPGGVGSAPRQNHWDPPEILDRVK